MTREEQDAILADLWEKDTNCKLIAKAIGLKDKNSVVARARKLGLPRRKVGPRPYAFPDLRSMRVGQILHKPAMTQDLAHRWRIAARYIWIKVSIKASRESGGYTVERLA